MSLKETLNRLSSTRSESSSQIREEVRLWAHAQGLFQTSARVVTVTGTNGKGTCVAWLSDTLLAAGYRVASYTSPHLFCVTERIALNGMPVSEACLENAYQTLKAQGLPEGIRYFELLTVLAFHIFSQSDADVWVLEVGIGGRLDCVNWMDTDLALITSIDWDHTDRLGNTREAIAYEKSGIFRPEKPAIVAASSVQSVCRAYAKEIGAVWMPPAADHMCFGEMPKSVCAVVTEAVSCFEKVTFKHLEQAAKTVALPGRKQWIQGRFPFPVLLDVAHNQEAVSSLHAVLLKKRARGKVLAWVNGMAAKPLPELCASMFDIVDAWVCVGVLDERAWAPEALQEALLKQGVGQVSAASSVSTAYEQLKEMSDVSYVVVWGGFSIVAETMQFAL